MMSDFLPLLLGGLVLFLYSITQLSNVLRGIFNERAKTIIAKSTSNVFYALFWGTLMTILLGPSSAVIILVIIFINAQSLTFNQAIGLIMGANIGTTFSSQLISMDIGQYAVYPLIIGLLFSIFTKKGTLQSTGKVMLYFGMLFFGLFIIESSVEPLRQSEEFNNWIADIEDNQYQGAFIGGLVTLIIQSSSGTVGMAIVLAKQNLISVAGGIAIMLGAELGTCSDTLIATVNGSRQAIKAGVFHLFFNLTTIIIGLLLFQPLVDLVYYLSGTSDIYRQIANAHMIFNILGVLLFIPFVPLIAKLLNRLIPEKKNLSKNLPKENDK